MNIEFKDDVDYLAKTKLNANKSMVFYGSSSLRLWGTLEKDFPSLEVLNIAFGGSTIEDCIGYYPQLLKETNPSMIVVYAGDNDLAHGASTEKVMDRFETLLSLIKEDFYQIPFVFISLKPSPAREVYLPKIKEINQRVKESLFVKDNCYYIDVFSKMMLSETKINTSIFCEDELHMNSKGYLIWKTVLGDFFKENKIIK